MVAQASSHGRECVRAHALWPHVLFASWTRKSNTPPLARPQRRQNDAIKVPENAGPEQRQHAGTAVMPMRFGQPALERNSNFVSIPLEPRSESTPSPTHVAAQQLRTNLLCRNSGQNCAGRRAFTEFRKKGGCRQREEGGEWWQARSGASDRGLSFAEFCRASHSYGMRWSEGTCRSVFAHLNLSGSGTISVEEFNVFIDPPSKLLSFDPRNFASSHRREPKLPTAAVDRPMSGVEVLISKLQGSFESRQYTGAACWHAFRNRCGLSGCKQPGVSFEQFVVGCRSLGLAFDEREEYRMFAAFEPDSEGMLCMAHFTAKLVGRTQDRGTGLSLAGTRQGPPNKPVHVHMRPDELSTLLSRFGVAENGQSFPAGQRVRRSNCP